jgi:hypothetical protein
VGVALMGVLSALFMLPMLGAGAQTNGSAGSNGVPPDPPGDCNVTSVTPNPVPAAGTQVTIVGTAPAADNLTVVLYDNGVPAVPSPGDKVTQLVTDGSFTLLYTIQQDTDLSVNFTFGKDADITAVNRFGVQHLDQDCAIKEIEVVISSWMTQRHTVHHGAFDSHPNINELSLMFIVNYDIFQRGLIDIHIGIKRAAKGDVINNIADTIDNDYQILLVQK